MIAIVDYGMGNLGSISNMFRKIGVPAVLTSDAGGIMNAAKIVLPGVGAFDAGMRNLEERGFIPVLRAAVIECRVPILGICLGMQLMAGKSEEGTLPGLGWLDADVVRFPSLVEDERLNVPHMGWNTILPKKPCPLFRGSDEESRFYFVHSYHVVCRDSSDVAAVTRHGVEFASAFQHGNLYGVQFHPEKSHRFGMGLLRNFVEFA